MEISDVLSTINKIWPSINGQVTGYFSTTIFDKIREDESRAVQASVIAVSISVFYIIVEPFIRKGVKYFQNVKKNVLWNEMIEEYMDVTYRFFLFIIIQYINLIIAREGSGFTQIGIFQQVVEMIIITFFLVSFVSMLEYLQEKLKSKNGYIEESITNFNRAYSGIYGVVIQFFSRSFFELVSEDVPNTMQAGLITLGFFCFYLVTEYVARELIEASDPNQKRRPLWDKILNDYLDFFYTFAIFIIIQYLGLFIGEEVSGDLGIFPELALVFAIFVFFYSMLRMIVELTKYSDHKKTWFITDTTKRIWPKINGTSTGLVASIITDRLLIGDDETFLIYLILVVLLYSFFDSLVRKAIEKVEQLKERQPLWNSVVEEILDFFFSLGILLFLSAVTEELGFLESEDLFETLIIVAISQIILSSVLISFRELGKPKQK